MYTGAAGPAMVYFLARDVDRCTTFLSEALERAHARKASRKRFSEHDVSMAEGMAGVFALSAVVHATLVDDEEEHESALEALFDLGERALADDFSSNEWLYGRAAYLSAVNFVVLTLGKRLASRPRKRLRRLAGKLFTAIVADGRAMAKEDAEEGGPAAGAPLMWAWHGKRYIGAVHGVSGILLVLLQAATFADDVSARHVERVKETLEWLVDHVQLPSGNFPSSLPGTRDKLVHFCHGAPGVGIVLVRAFQLFGTPKFLAAALRAGDVVWERGLLKKGHGLCHGIGGNGFLHLALFQATKDAKHFRRAVHFATFVAEARRVDEMDEADTPESLFQGAAGGLALIYGVLAPSRARFPAFDYPVERPTSSTWRALVDAA